MTPELDTIVCARAEDYLPTIPDGFVNLIITSPPYDQMRAYHGFKLDFEFIARESYRVLSPGGVMVWVVKDQVVDKRKSLTSLRQALYFTDQVGYWLHDEMIAFYTGTNFPDPTRYSQQFDKMYILSKGKPATVHLQTKMNRWAGDKRHPQATKTQKENDGSTSIRRRKPVKKRGVYPNVWVIHRGYGKSTKDRIAFKHPAIFPELLVERHIETWSNTGHIVLDFFMGSGTVAKIARKLGRHFLGCDISQEYVDIAKQRLYHVSPQAMELPDNIEQLLLFEDLN